MCGFDLHSNWVGHSFYPGATGAPMLIRGPKDVARTAGLEPNIAGARFGTRRRRKGLEERLKQVHQRGATGAANSAAPVRVSTSH